jgi:hypothetical protein
VVVHNSDPSTQKAEAGGLQIQGQPGLSYVVRPCLKPLP